jgi:hypothetical protein
LNSVALVPDVHRREDPSAPIRDFSLAQLLDLPCVRLRVGDPDVIEQPSPSQLGEDIDPTTPGMAMCDEPPIAILKGQRRAGAAMTGAAASPPAVRPVSLAEPCGDFSRVHAQRPTRGMQPASPQGGRKIVICLTHVKLETKLRLRIRLDLGSSSGSG